MQNQPCAEPQLEKQYQGPKQDKLVILPWNANGILREHIGRLARMSVLDTEVDGSKHGSSMLFP